MRGGFHKRAAEGAILALVVNGAAASLSAAPPVNILPSPAPTTSSSVAPTPAPSITPAAVAPPAPEPSPIALVETNWNAGDARALLAAINAIAADGLIPADYQPRELEAAIAAGEGAALSVQASRSFTWLVEDLRDGRTPMPARVQWFAVDPDQDLMPTPQLMTQALTSHDVAGVLTGLAPAHPDYAVLKAALAETPASAAARRGQIRANMDRWRWLARDMGRYYLITNVPEFQLRLTVNNRIISTYRTIVGRPGRTATPQLAEQVQAVVFNPTWTVPQSIVQGEGLGPRLMRNPAQARRDGYAVSRAANGTITVVQQPGRGNSLGVMKIDMPNPHAIYLHDTPNHALFNATVRAFSHGCVRTERAQELGITMAILGADMTPEQGTQYANSGRYNRVVMARPFPVYITYFTMARNIAGNLASFADIYGRDAPVLASFNQPRALKTSQRASTEEVIRLDNPL
jgi:L,D-transpeptidase YcbB